MRDSVALGLAEMIRGGTTCINDMYFFNESLVEVAAAAGIRATCGLVVLDFPHTYAPAGPDDYISKGLALADAHAGNDLIRLVWADVDCGVG